MFSLIKIRNMKATKEELLMYSAELLSQYNIPVEFMQDALFLDNAIDKVAEKLNIFDVMPSVCGECWGSGWKQQFVQPCKKCNGTGKI